MENNENSHRVGFVGGGEFGFDRVKHNFYHVQRRLRVKIRAEICHNKRVQFQIKQRISFRLSWKRVYF